MQDELQGRRRRRLGRAGSPTAGTPRTKGYIGAQQDPLDASKRVTRYTVHDGDVFMGGERCETLTHKIGGGMGSRFQVGFEISTDPAFWSDGSAWNSLWDMHYPNDGPAQSPLTVSIRNTTELWLRVMAPNNTNYRLGTIEKARKYTVCHDIKQDPKGFIHTWLDGVLVHSFEGPTLQSGVPNTTYWKQGHYRSESNPAGTNSYFFGDTVCWYNDTPDEMLAYFGIEDGGGVPVPPGPSPVEASCSIQSGDVLVGVVPVNTLVSAGQVDQVDYYLDNAKVAKSMTPPDYPAAVDLTHTPEGDHTFGFVFLDKGVEVLNTYKAYPVSVHGTPSRPLRWGNRASPTRRKPPSRRRR
jgi:hypothetical protein